MFGKTKRTISTLLAVMLVCTLFSATGAAQRSADDLAGHWAESDLRKWVESGLLTGYDDGTYRPDQKITRAEFVTLINRSFELSGEADIVFSDVSPGNWMYEQIGIAVEAGYITGYQDGTFKPKNGVTREEAAYMVSALLQLEGAPEALVPYDDVSGVSDAGKQVLSALVQAGILKGGAPGKLNPKGGLTRAQAVTVLEEAFAVANPTTTYNQPGVYGPESGKETIQGNVVIAAAGVTLQNVDITGDLTVTPAVGEGDAFFKGITVQGETFIQGGGANSIHFEDSVLVRIAVDKRDGSVRVVVVGESSIQHVLVKSPVKLEESGVTSSGFANVELSDALPNGSQIDLVGQFESIDVLSSDIKVSVPSGSIKELNVQENASNTQINLSKDATVLKLVLNTVAELLGQGKVQEATVNKGAEGSNFETKPEAVKGEGASTATPAPTPIVNPGPGVTPGPSSTTEPLPTATPSSSASPSSTPSPTPSPCTVDSCTSASLVDLTVGDFTLNQLTGDYTNAGETGFQSHTLGYSIITDRDMVSVSVPVTVTQSAYTTAQYSVWDGQNENYRGGQVGSEPFEVAINPMKDSRISINVYHENGISSKRYDIFIQYPRTLQEGFKLLRHFNSRSAGNEYNYTLASGTLNGERLLHTDTIQVYGSSADEQPVQTCGGRTCSIPSQLISGDAGSLYIKVYRSQTILIEGEYHYDLEPIEKIDSDGIVSIKRWTKQELIDEFVKYPSSRPYSHGITNYVDPVKLKEVLPDVKFVGDGLEFINVDRSEYPSGLEMDIAKAGISPRGYPGYTFTSVNRLYGETSQVQVGGALFYTSDNEDASKEVEDLFIYFIFYDADLNPIGYTVQAVTFDEDHVADGYTPSNHWKPTP